MPSTFTSLHYHLIFGTKNREPFLRPPFLAPIHAYLGGCIRRSGAVPVQIGGVEDHVHILVRMKPTGCVANLLRDIKKPSSEWLRHEMNQRQFHWQDGYSAFTVGIRKSKGSLGTSSIRRSIIGPKRSKRSIARFWRLTGSLSMSDICSDPVPLSRH
jgi:REP element-mobilizing transposase RayT